MTQHEIEILAGRGGPGSYWQTQTHRAACGAYCSGGIYTHAEKDLHVELDGVCPRCGVSENNVVKTVLKPDGTERLIVFHHTLPLGSSNFSFALEVATDTGWTRKFRMTVNDDGSADNAVRRAGVYWPWLLNSDGP